MSLLNWTLFLTYINDELSLYQCKEEVPYTEGVSLKLVPKGFDVIFFRKYESLCHGKINFVTFVLLSCGGY